MRHGAAITPAAFYADYHYRLPRCHATITRHACADADVDAADTDAIHTLAAAIQRYGRHAFDVFAYCYAISLRLFGHTLDATPLLMARHSFYAA